MEYGLPSHLPTSRRPFHAAINFDEIRNQPLSRVIERYLKRHLSGRQIIAAEHHGSCWITGLQVASQTCAQEIENTSF
jgi:hypothetical protein